MDYNLQIQKLLIQADNELTEQGEIIILKQAIAVADSHNDIEWGFDLRLDLFETFRIADINEMMPAFVWLLDAYDNNSDLFDENELLWIYDWMIDTSARDYNISLEQIDSMLEDYKNRLLRNGMSIRTYYKSKIGVGFIIENLGMVKENIELRNKSERDKMSSSEYDDLYDEILYFLQTANISEAVKLYPKVLQLNTNSITISSSYAEELIRCKRYDIVNKYIDDAIKDLSESKDRYLMVAISSIVFALFRINKIKDAWYYFENSINWYSKTCEYDILLWGLNVLPLLACGGKRELNLKTDLPFYNESGVYDVSQLYQYVYGKVSYLSTVFDKRNRCNYFEKQISEFSKI